MIIAYLFNKFITTIRLTALQISLSQHYKIKIKKEKLNQNNIAEHTKLNFKKNKVLKANKKL